MSVVVGLTRPTHLEPDQWLTVRGCKKILAVASTLTYTQRLLDIVGLFESDLRVEVSFTVAPHPFGEGVHRFLDRLGCPVLPWEEAVRSAFDLVLAVGVEGIDRLSSPVFLLSHGAGHNKLRRLRGGRRARQPGMLSRVNLFRDGRVVPHVLALAHRDELATLAADCPEALPAARVVGDPAYDRLLVSLPRRAAYRAALGVEPEQRLVLVTCTWGESGTFPRLDALLPRLLSELPGPAYRTAVLTHPNIAAGHSWWQVKGWLKTYGRRGVVLVPPEADYLALLSAADYVIGDHGSATCYASLTGAPILLARYPQGEVHPASPAAALGRTTPALSPALPLARQLRYARARYRREELAAVASRISSEPGRFYGRARALAYRHLGIGEPAVPAVAEPAAPPAPLEVSP